MPDATCSNSDGIAFAIETQCLLLPVRVVGAPTVTESLSRLKLESFSPIPSTIYSSNSDGIAFAIETLSMLPDCKLMILAPTVTESLSRLKLYQLVMATII